MTIESFAWLLAFVPADSLDIGLPRGELYVCLSHRDVRIVKGDRVVVITREGDRLAFAYHRIANGYQPLVDPAFERETPALFARALEIVRDEIDRKAADRERAIHEPVPEALDEIARLLVREPAPILEQLALCRADKVNYVAQRRLRGRAVDVVPGLGWFALVDALLEHDHAVVVDWRAMWEEVEPELDRLVARALSGRRVVWPKNLGGLETGKALETASKALVGNGKTMIHLPCGWDAYVVALAWETKLAQLQRAARAAGHEISQRFR